LCLKFESAKKYYLWTLSLKNLIFFLGRTQVIFTRAIIINASENACDHCMYHVFKYTQIDNTYFDLNEKKKERTEDTRSLYQYK
jgi:hypothetical protein